MTPITNSCEHKDLILEPSQHSSEAGFLWSTSQKRVAATTSQGRVLPLSSAPAPTLTTFPGPLVLPEDDLALDPKYPAQSLRSWIRLKERNHVSKDRKTVYVAAPPAIGVGVDVMRSWSIAKSSEVLEPKTQDVIDYLAAFYDGLPVKSLPLPLSYTAWDGKKPLSKSKQGYIGLDIGESVVRIRTRARAPSELFIQQLNLDDLLDGAISLLPDDAYALLMLVSHDVYESDDDDFACGRAYGGSRVAVVSFARYNPILDDVQNVEREHAWPASHCSTYVQSCCESEPLKKRKKSIKSHSSSADETEAGPIHDALAAYRAVPPLSRSSSSSALYGLWLGRVCRTASHELGHCFGMDHCVYYACAMQGTASLGEDARQPPYLCPVDLAKLLQACNTTSEARYKALLAFCSRYKEVHHFAAFAAWLQCRLVLSSTVVA